MGRPRLDRLPSIRVEIANRLLSGHSAEKIAADLGMSEESFQKHWYRIRQDDRIRVREVIPPRHARQLEDRNKRILAALDVLTNLITTRIDSDATEPPRKLPPQAGDTPAVLRHGDERSDP